jgi:HK97 family phage prohead protease
MENRREMRYAEIRALNDQEMIVEGRAIVFDIPTVVFESGGLKYYEVIARGALDGADLRDVAFKYNHSDAVMVMARTRNKTLELLPDDRGLLIRAKLANTSQGRDLYELIRRGDVDKMSFAFTVLDENYDKETRTRKILKFKRIWDVSAVDIPAYADTHIHARNYFAAQVETDALREVSLRKRKIRLKERVESHDIKTNARAPHRYL